MKPKLSTPPSADVLAAAFESHRAEIEALPEQALITRTNFDVATAVSIVLGAVPALSSLRGDIAKQLPAMPLRYVDDIEGIAHAALHAHIATMIAPVAVDALPLLTEDARKLRKVLLADAQAALVRGILAEGALDEVPTGGGRLDVAQGLLAVGVVMRSAWPRLKGRTGTTDEDLDQAARLGVSLLAELGRDENPTASRGDRAREITRLRACTLLVNAWDECRRAVTWLRWHEDDVSDFTPALAGSHGPRAKKPEAQPAPANPVTH